MNEDKISRMNEYINMEEALKRVAGNTNIFKKLIASYKNNTYAEKLIEDHNGGNIEEGVKSAHTIKGVTANLSFTRLNELSVKIEACLKNGGLCPELIAELDEADKLTREYIDYITETT